MNVRDFLDHFGISGNPFRDEDAKEDSIFNDGCMRKVRHPAWDKVFGNPGNPSSSIVFGEKGSGKTALRLQMVDAIRQHNREAPDHRIFLIEYDDFNPFLNAFTHPRTGGWLRSKQLTLQEWRLWDHMDAILSVAVCKLIDSVVASVDGQTNHCDPVAKDRLRKLPRLQGRDLLMLAAVYDRSAGMSTTQRFNRLRKAIRFSLWPARWGVFGAGLLSALVAIGSVRFLPMPPSATWIVCLGALFLTIWLPCLVRYLSCFRLAGQVVSNVRVLQLKAREVRDALLVFRKREVKEQPIVEFDSTDARYVLINKLQEVLRHLGFDSVMVLVDRVDEPHLVNGQADAMHQLMRSIFDLKFLKHPGLGVKLLLPRDMFPHVSRESSEFQERARLDKQNLIPSLEWTGESLYDLANARIRSSCAGANESPLLMQLMAEDVSERDLIEILGRLKIPRHLFKFLYQLFSAHCMTFTADKPSWQIGRETLKITWALFERDMERYGKGMVVA